MVVAARQVGKLPAGLADSKVLSKKRREFLFYDIQIACELGEGWVRVAEINKLGLSKAMYLGVRRALIALDANPDEEIIMDGNINYCPKKYRNATCLIDADATQPIVSAASIYAKVLRDKYMTDISAKFPYYQFDRHVGYGTKLHKEMLALYGACELHRLSFKPLRELAG